MQKSDNKPLFVTVRNDTRGFYLSTQTDGFLKNNPLVKNYKWNNVKKEGLVYLDSGDSIEVIRGGCNHFLFECSKDVGALDYLKSSKEEFALKTAIGMAFKLFPKDDAQLFDSLVSHQDYTVERSKDDIYWDLNYDGYVNTEISLMYWKHVGYYSVSVGYTIN
jgi:hypothetical protein